MGQQGGVRGAWCADRGEAVQVDVGKRCRDENHEQSPSLEDQESKFDQTAVFKAGASISLVR